MTVKNLEAHLEEHYNMVAGEGMLDGIKQKLTEIFKKTLKVSGRSFEAGRKKTVHIPVANLLK